MNLPDRMTAIAALLCVTFAVSPSISAKKHETKACDRLPMSTYIWHGCMKDSDFVSRINFHNFDIVYLMDKQGWQSQEDFDLTIDSIINTENATVRLSKPERFRQAVATAHAEGTRAVLSTGNDMIFGAIDNTRTEKMCKAIAKTIENFDFDGVDLDWEIGIYSRMDRHANLLTTLRRSLDSLGNVTGKKYIVSTALSVEAQYPDSLRKELEAAVDHINLMAYDLGGCLWREYGTHNTPMEFIENSVAKRWYGIPRKKLHLGLASYGFRYDGILPGEIIPGGKKLSSCGRYVNYNDMLPYIFGTTAWRAEYDPIEKMNYYINDTLHSFITIETPETVIHKFEYAADAGLGGTFWWEYAKDIVPDNNGGKKWKHILIPDHKQISPLKQKK